MASQLLEVDGGGVVVVVKMNQFSGVLNNRLIIVSSSIRHASAVVERLWSPRGCVFHTEMLLLVLLLMLLLFLFVVISLLFMPTAMLPRFDVLLRGL